MNVICNIRITKRGTLQQWDEKDYNYQVKWRTFCSHFSKRLALRTLQVIFYIQARAVFIIYYSIASIVVFQADLLYYIDLPETFIERL